MGKYMGKYIPTCCVADQFCTAPANVSFFVIAKGICFACGQNVCSKCSSKRKYYDYGTVRLCNDCQVNYDESDKTVMKRLIKLCG